MIKLIPGNCQRAILEQYGASVTAAGSAAEAQAAIAGGKPDVLISDIGMPGEDGYQLIRKVQQLLAERGGQIPAVALAAYAREEERHKAVQACFHAHLPEPVEPDQFAAAVASLAHQR